MAKKCAIYTRVSSMAQAAEGKASLDIQLEQSRALAEEKGYQVIAEIQDISPGTNRKRKGYRQICGMVERGEIDSIVCWAEDRLYRGLSVIHFSDAYQKNPTVKAELVHGSWDPTTMLIMAGVAEIELSVTRRRTEGGIRAALARGELPPGPPKYGYMRDEGNKAAINEAEAKVVRKIFASYIEGIPWLQVRERLDAEGFATRTGGLWPRVRLIRLVNDETYVSGKRILKRGKQDVDLETFEIDYPPIIDEKIWLKAKQKRQANRDRWRGHHTKTIGLLQGLIFCGTHGRRLNLTARRKSGHGPRYRCDYCADYPEAANEECCRALPVSSADHKIWGEVMGIWLHPASLIDAVGKRLAELEEGQDDVEARINELRLNLDRVDRERHELFRLARRGLITDEEISFQSSELDFQQLHLTKELEKAEGDLAATINMEELRIMAEGDIFQDTLIEAQFLDWIIADAQLLKEKPLTWRGEKITFRKMFKKYEAQRFLDLFDGDEVSALNWAISDRKKALIRQFIEKVEVRRIDGVKVLKPHFRIELPLPSAEELTRSDNLVPSS